MSILLVAPDSFQGQTKGLMGTWNGDASDDFLTPQGTFLSPGLTTEQLHDQFGLQCKILYTTFPPEIFFFIAKYQSIRIQTPTPSQITTP